MITYFRPQTVTEAITLLNTPDARAVAIGGGTATIGRLPADTDAVVDLQALPLDRLDITTTAARVGALVRLQTLLDQPDLPPALASLIRYEAPRTVRNAATLGGLVAAQSADSELYAALLALDALITLQDISGATTVSLAAFEPRAGTLITEISWRAPLALGHARVARTPMDRPIVAAVAAAVAVDDTAAVRLALCGVADRPVLVAPDAVADVDPPADFRGSADYRRHMARVLSRRALDALSAA